MLDSSMYVSRLLLVNGERIRKQRQLAGLSVFKLAVKVGVDPNTIHRWERSEMTPTPKNLKRLSRILRTPIAYLRGE